MKPTSTVNLEAEPPMCVGSLSPTAIATPPAPTGELAGRRILFVMPSIPLQGMERASIQIMWMLAQAGARVMCVTERTHGKRVRDAVEKAGCEWTDIDCDRAMRVPRSPWELCALIFSWTRFAGSLTKIMKSFEPTHVHVANLSFFLYALPALWRCGRPVVFRLPNPPDHGLSGRKRVISNWIWRRCVGSVCDAVVCNSEFGLAQLRKTGVEFRGVHLIHNCLPQRATPAVSDVPELSRDRFKIVYIGRVRPDKGCDVLVDAALRMLEEGRPIELLLAGEYAWQNAFAEALIDRVRRSGWEKHIRFLGELQDVFGLLDACDVHVHPSQTETFSNAVLEAKSRGVPSVAFRRASLPEQICHLEDGYLCSEVGCDALYEGLRYFMDHPDRLQAAHQAARKSLSRYSVERAAKAWVQLYQSL
ncbi:MAG TPA: glycosyltransferase family 4 protein [Pirellulales bacterium]|nr:glycosyltransferase family 4 protein [Pirellulales bacterium]